MKIWQIIMKQINYRRLAVMVGGWNALYSEEKNYFCFKFKASKSYNFCRITYNEGTTIHDRTQISYLDFSGITKDLCSDCHTEELTRLNRQLHNTFNCIDCHNEHGILKIDFNNCISCHDSPSDHDTTLTSCSDPTCHDQLRSIHSKI